MWLVGALGVIAGLVLMVYVPSLKPVSNVLFLFAGFHLVGAVVLAASIYVMAGRGIFRRWSRRRNANDDAAKYDFGWAPAWTLGPWIAALVMASATVAVYAAAPAWWPFAFLFTLLAASFFAGALITASSTRPDHAVLPMVDLLSGESDLVLDGGCGAGRTTVALGRALKKGRIVALDRFDSDYIEGGGRALLERNLRLAALDERVEIRQGDLTQLPFPDRTFDSAVSAHAMDHLGPQIIQGLSEMRRVLKPGGRFLLVVWVPGWAMFAIASVLAFFLTGKREWKQLTNRAGFQIRDQGHFNGFWFLLLEKPASAALAGD
ncbi:SAM-dependent methlyltransferase [Sulfuricaulis limicola]|uniref:SAM-dependent methlyltransferase n=1 Tax=Sulfuricaulis limicola TaxID=1620215 RepID=A0A1B4XDN6_9GAMM|nr:class I SAM-dependent methyltransferase [Sulfuricaulis limicola]BAV32910.1 SAM-dependent methlyltransferase [Sulfuricaulis limicola]